MVNFTVWLVKTFILCGCAAILAATGAPGVKMSAIKHPLVLPLAATPMVTVPALKFATPPAFAEEPPTLLLTTMVAVPPVPVVVSVSPVARQWLPKSNPRTPKTPPPRRWPCRISWWFR